MSNQSYVSDLWFRYQLSDFDVNAQLLYVKQLDTYLSTGVGIQQSIEYTQEAFGDLYQKNCVEYKVSQLLLDAAEQGNFDEVLNKYFHPNIGIAFQLIRNSTDKNIISEIGNLIKLEKDMKTSTFWKLISPALFFLLGLAALIIMGSMVLPTMIDFDRLGNQELPFEILLSLTVSNVFLNTWYLFIIIPVAMSVFIKYSLPNLLPSNPIKTKIRNFIDFSWPISLYKSLWTIRLLKMYGLLKKSDMADVDIIELIKLFSPPFIQFFLNKMSLGFEGGTDKHEYFMHGLLSKSQELKLRPFMSHCSDSEFADQLLDTSEKGKEELEIQFSKSSSRKCAFLYALGGSFVFFAIGSVIEASLIRY